MEPSPLKNQIFFPQVSGRNLKKLDHKLVVVFWEKSVQSDLWKKPVVLKRWNAEGYRGRLKNFKEKKLRANCTPKVKVKNKGATVLEARIKKFSNLWNTNLPTCSAQKLDTSEQILERSSREIPVEITAQVQANDPDSKQKIAAKEDLSPHKSAKASSYSAKAVWERQPS